MKRSCWVAAACAVVFVEFSGCAYVARPEETAVSMSAGARVAMYRLIEQRPGWRAARAIAATGSMAPTLDEHFVAIVEKRPFAALAVGDIVGEAFGADVIAHRIVRKSGPTFATQGDALGYIDPPPLTEDDYTGEVVIAAIDTRTGEVRLMTRQPKQWRTSHLAGDAATVRPVGGYEQPPLIANSTSTPAAPAATAATNPMSPNG